MSFTGFKDRMLAGDRLVGTFLKTPAYELVEMLAGSALDFICLDAEHAPFDRGRLDACLAMSRALDFPTFVRVASAAPENILQALDSGALGVVVPHVDTPEKAAAVARAARFGEGGRGFAGSTRWAGLTRRKMPDILRQSVDETIVLAQIEEPLGVDNAAAIAATDGVDGLFVGPADLTVAYGERALWSDHLMEAYASVHEACRASAKTHVTFVAGPGDVPRLADYGVSMFFVSSEVGLMAAEASRVAQAISGVES